MGDDLDLEELALVIHDNAVEKGFWAGEVDINFILAKLALVHSEVSEILEAVRKQKGSVEIMDEFADVVIRLLDLYVGMKDTGWVDGDITYAIERKVHINTSRPKMHGNLI